MGLEIALNQSSKNAAFHVRRGTPHRKVANVVVILEDALEGAIADVQDGDVANGCATIIAESTVDNRDNAAAVKHAAAVINAAAIIGTIRRKRAIADADCRLCKKVVPVENTAAHI